MNADRTLVEDTRRRTGRRWPALWFGLLAGPAAWAVQIFTLYALEDVVACTPGSRTPGVILGLGVRPLALLITAVLAGVTVAAGLVSLREWRRTGTGAGDTTTGQSAAWMSLGGILFSALFLLIILVKVAPPVMLAACGKGV